MFERLKELWQSVSVPVDISECKTLGQARRWFYYSGVPEAKQARTKAQLRAVLVNKLEERQAIGNDPLSGEIRDYLQNQLEPTDEALRMRKLEKAVEEADSPEAFTKATAALNAAKKRRS